MTRTVRMLATLACCSAATATAQSRGALESLRRATVSIAVTAGANPIVATGLVVGTTPGGIALVATAAHIFRGATAVRITSAGRVFPVNGVLDLDETLDFALLAVDGLQAPAVTKLDIAVPLSVGFPTVVVTAARAGQPQVASVRIASLARASDGRTMLQLSVPNLAVWVGAPVATSDGLLLGISVRPPAVAASALPVVLSIGEISDLIDQNCCEQPVSLAEAFDPRGDHPWERTRPREGGGLIRMASGMPVGQRPQYDGAAMGSPPPMAPPPAAPSRDPGPPPAAPGSGRPAGQPLPPTPSGSVRVFFATDRKQTGQTKPDDMFGGDRADDASPFSYGSSVVSFPLKHEPGEIERPSLFRFEFRENPDKHVVVESVTRVSADVFFAQLGDRIRAAKRKAAFVFVHGYNVSFVEAARRTAQIAYDLHFDGAPVFYSWPSQGNAAQYTVDEQNVEWSQPNLRRFLDDFLTRSTAEDVYVVAHSMGNRAATRAVASLLADKPALRDRVKEVILAAPDVDASVFKRDIAPALKQTGRPVTLYVSSEDEALKASKKVHGYARAGDAGPTLVVAPGIETIDASGLDPSLMGHSYFAESGPLLADILEIFERGTRADKRGRLTHIWTAQGYYWTFVP